MSKSLAALGSTIASALAGCIVVFLAKHAPYVHVTQTRLSAEILFGGGMLLHYLHGHTHLSRLLGKGERLIGLGGEPFKPVAPLTRTSTTGSGGVATFTNTPPATSAGPTAAA